MDGHVGCQLWQRAVLRELGMETKVLSLRRSDRLPQLPRHDNPLSAREQTILENIKRLWRGGGGRRAWNKAHTALLRLTCGAKNIADLFGGHDVLLGSYPPGVGRLLFDLARGCGSKVILNLGNRCSLDHPSARKFKSFAALLTEIHESREHVLAAMHEYDFQYARHYLGLEPLKLYVACHHLPLRRHRPTRDQILVGPASSPAYAHALTPRGSSEDMNAAHETWRAKNGRRKKLRFDSIRNLYPNYAWRDLAQHPAVVIFPYSSFSVSMAELYEMNVPFFVPSADFLIRHGMPQEIVNHRCQAPPHPRSPHPCSFHDGEQAMAYWLRFCYFYQLENAVVWDSEADLFQKLNDCDFSEISEKMYAENRARRRESLRRWDEVLQGIAGQANNE